MQKIDAGDCQRERGWGEVEEVKEGMDGVRKRQIWMASTWYSTQMRCYRAVHYDLLNNVTPINSIKSKNLKNYH